MTGLTNIDRLTLTPRQWLALLATLVLSLCADSAWGVMMVGIIPFVGFWGVRHSLDMRLAWREAESLQDRTWGGFVRSYHHSSYLRNQTPFVGFGYARLHDYRFWQAAAWLVSLAIVGLLIRSHGIRFAAYAQASPLFTLMRVEPTADLLAFALIVLAASLAPAQPALAGLCIFGAISLKLLAVLSLPRLLSINIYSVLFPVLVFMVGWIALRRRFGCIRKQERFLTNQIHWILYGLAELCGQHRRFPQSMQRTSAAHVAQKVADWPAWCVTHIAPAYRWRLRYLGNLAFYLFPAYFVFSPVTRLTLGGLLLARLQTKNALFLCS